MARALSKLANGGAAAVQPKERKGAERGATMVEYAVMVALIAVVVIAAVRILGTSVSTQFSRAAGQVN